MSDVPGQSGHALPSLQLPLWAQKRTRQELASAAQRVDGDRIVGTLKQEAT